MKHIALAVFLFSEAGQYYRAGKNSDNFLIYNNVRLKISKKLWYSSAH